MTNKEFVASIRPLFQSMNNDLREQFNKLERDVEVLDILKSYFSSTENGQWYIDVQESDFDFKSECTKKEWENSPQKKIKDWLCSGEYLK